MKLNKILFVLLTLVLLPTVVLALAPSPNSVPQPPTGVNSVEAIFGTFKTIVNWMFAFLMVLIVVFLFYAAFEYLTAAGDSSKVGNAKTAVLYALIAAIIALGAQAIISVAANIIGSTSVTPL